MTTDTDREALAALLDPLYSSDFVPEDEAGRILASDWFAAHDAAIRKEAREAGRNETLHYVTVVTGPYARYKVANKMTEMGLEHD
jgi:hypothetical protein